MSRGLCPRFAFVRGVAALEKRTGAISVTLGPSVKGFEISVVNGGAIITSPCKQKCCDHPKRHSWLENA